MAPPRRKVKAPKKSPPPPEEGYRRADRPGKVRRHPRYDELRDTILEQLYDGQPLRTVIRDLSLTMWEHHEVCKGNPQWAEEVAKARAAGRHALADRLLDPAEYPEGKIANAWSRSVQWNLERTDRDNYGPRLDVRHNVQIHLVAGLEHAAEAERRIIEERALEAKVASRPALPANDGRSEGIPARDDDWERVDDQGNATGVQRDDEPAPRARSRRKK